MEFGVQQLQLGKILTNAKKAKNALIVMKKSGYNFIELNGFMIRKTPIFVKILMNLFSMPIKRSQSLPWKNLLNETDIKVSSIHEDIDTLEKNKELVVKECNMFDTKKVVLTGVYNFKYNNKETVLSLCKRLNSIVDLYRDENIEILYHNHNVEFVRIDKNKTAYDLIIENTTDKLGFEFDSYWPSVSGIDAVKYMKRISTRQKILHINDNSQASNKFITPIIKTKACELNRGFLNLDNITKQAKENNVEYIILEQHNNYIHNDPIESLVISSEYLNEIK